MRSNKIPHGVWRRAPYGVCGLVSCATCEYFQKGLCPACVRGNAAAARERSQVCAIYECVRSQGLESCRECRLSSCSVLDAGQDIQCGLAESFAGKRGGTSMVRALGDLKSVQDTHPPVDLPPRLLRRLPAYLMALQELAREGVETVVSAELALRIGASPALVRKDLSTAGHWGRRSAGYRVDVLTDNLRRAAGLANPRHAAWLGCESLMKRPHLLEEFRYAGCVVAAAFCEDGEHVGERVDALVIRPVRELPVLAKRFGITVAVVAVDDARAQRATEVAVSAGVRFVLNLTNKVLVQPRGATIENVNPMQGLVSLLLRAPVAEPAPEDKATRGKRSS